MKNIFKTVTVTLLIIVTVLLNTSTVNSATEVSLEVSEIKVNTTSLILSEGTTHYGVSVNSATNGLYLQILPVDSRVTITGNGYFNISSDKTIHKFSLSYKESSKDYELMVQRNSQTREEKKAAAINKVKQLINEAILFIEMFLIFFTIIIIFIIIKNFIKELLSKIKRS